MPEIGYQEVYLARSFCRLGYDVRVFSSAAVSPAKRHLLDVRYSVGVSADGDYGFSVERIPTAFSVGSIVIGRGLWHRLMSFSPNLVVAIGIGKLFPDPVFKGTSSYDVISLFGDNAAYFSWSTIGGTFRGLKNLATRSLVKSRFYKKAMAGSRRVVAYTPETARILARVVGKRVFRQYGGRIQQSRLGFDPDEFFYSSVERAAGRAEIGAAEKDIVLVTATRVTKSKGLENLICTIGALQRNGLPLRYVLVGLTGASYDAAIRRALAKHAVPERCVCLPFSSHDRMRALFNAADMGIWTQPAISIQEGMGTGLFVLLPRHPAVSHLVESGTGVYSAEEDLRPELEKAVVRLASQSLDQRESARAHAVRINKKYLSYDAIAQEMIADLQ